MSQKRVGFQLCLLKPLVGRTEARVCGKGFEKCSQEKSWFIWLHLRWLCTGLKSPAQFLVLRPGCCQLTGWLAGLQTLSCLEDLLPTPHSQWTTIMTMQMHSVKAWDTTSYQPGLELFEVTGLCQFQLTWVFCPDISYLFAWKLQFLLWKLLGRSKKILFGKTFSQGPNGYKSWQRESQRVISVSL